VRGELGLEAVDHAIEASGLLGGLIGELVGALLRTSTAASVAEFMTS